MNKSNRILEPINFINPTIAGTINPVYSLLVHCAISGFGFKQAHEFIASRGCRITEKQYNAFETVINEQLNLDIGGKQKYLYTNNGHEEVSLPKA